MNQTMLDLIAWVEDDVAPPASTHFTIDGMNQVVLPADADERGGIQPVITLTANGGSRAEVGVGEPVLLEGLIELPARRGRIVQHDWYLGNSSPVAYEPPIVFARSRRAVRVSRRVTYDAPGSYLVTLRAVGQRNRETDPTTNLNALNRVRVVVHGPASVASSSPGAAGETASGRLSVESTKIGTLLDNPATLAILSEHLPNFVNSGGFSAWRNLSLREVQALVGQSLRDEQLNAIQADFDGLAAE